ncbi:MAG: hypothetical protein IH942_01320 [Acidobacteria bacterium]|nr:hypothetical protein [Acidobacteriota bacterium]
MSVTETGRTKLLGLFAAGDPRGEVNTAWHAKEVVRQIYSHTDGDLTDGDLADVFVARFGPGLVVPSRGPNVGPHDLPSEGSDHGLALGPRLERPAMRWRNVMSGSVICVSF